MTVHGSRVPNGLWKSSISGDPPVAQGYTWTVPEMQLFFFGNFTTGTDDGKAALYDTVQQSYLQAYQTGRQKVKFVPNQRDKNLIFEGQAPYNLLAVFFPTVGNQAPIDPSQGDVVADIRLTRWGFAAAALLTGDTYLDMRKRMAWANLGPAQMAKYCKSKEASACKDVKICLTPMPDDISTD